MAHLVSPATTNVWKSLGPIWARVLYALAHLRRAIQSAKESKVFPSIAFGLVPWRLMKLKRC